MAPRDNVNILVTGDVIRDLYLAIVPGEEEDQTIRNHSHVYSGAVLLQRLLTRLYSRTTGGGVKGLYAMLDTAGNYKWDLFQSELSDSIHKETAVIEERLFTNRVWYDGDAYRRYEQKPLTRVDSKASTRDTYYHRFRDNWVSQDWAKHVELPDAKSRQDFERTRDSLTTHAWRINADLGRDSHLVSSETPQFLPFSCLDDPQLVVITDENAGFRSRDFQPNSFKDVWTVAVCKYDREFDGARNKLFPQLANLSKLVVMLDANSLRSAGVKLSRGLSWETVCCEVHSELQSNGQLKAFAKVPHVVIVFPYVGAIYVARQVNGEKTFYLISDPYFLECLWEEEYPGGINGRTLTITACVAQAIGDNLINATTADQEGTIVRGIKNGLASTRYLLITGFVDERPQEEDHTAPNYPFHEVATFIAQDTTKPEHTSKCFQDIRLVEDELSAINNGAASLLDIALAWHKRSVPESVAREDTNAKRYLEAARRVSLNGLKKGLVGEPETGANRDLVRAPVITYGDLQLYDRQQIESFSSIRLLIDNYLQGESGRPFSFAVFGAPGSGKSFAVRELAKSIHVRSYKFDFLPFNLSQFTSTDELTDAFNHLRDVRFSKDKVALVFWDEFDCKLGVQPLFWLKYFLAPMQDGTFRQSRADHPVGKAIFVFAGGIYDSFAKFKGANVDDAKLTDFVSRLRGHIDIPGLNPKAEDGDPRDDICVIRRAFMLNATLQREYKGKLFRRGELQIQSNVLEALLTAKRYEHNSRSLEYMLSMCRLRDVGFFGPAHLPAPEQLIGIVEPNRLLR